MTADGRMIEVATPEVGGVTLRRHMLDLEASKLSAMAQRLGNRLRLWIRRMPDVTAQRVIGRDPDSGRDLFDDILDAEGKTITVPWLPDRDFRETFEQYSKVVLGLLKEQRERAKLIGKQGAPPVSDDVFDAQLGELARAAVLEMPKAELELLIRQRAIDVPVGEPLLPDDPRLKL